MKKKLTDQEQKEAFILPLFKKNYSLSEIVMLTGIPMKEVKRIIAPLEKELEEDEKHEKTLEDIQTRLADIVENWGKSDDNPKKE